MPVDNEAVIEALKVLSEEEGLRICIKESLKGGLIAGVSTICGGLLLGPVGLALGGLIGGLSAAAASENFRPVAIVIMNMTPQQKEELVQNLQRAVQNIDATDLILLASLLNTNAGVKEIGVQVLRTYLSNNMGLRIAN